MRLDQIPVVSGGHGLSGHAEEFRTNRLSFIRRALAEGDMVRLRLFARPVVMMTTPEFAHQVLVEKARSFAKSPATRLMLHPLAGEGLFTSEGPLWKKQRKLMAPMFHHAQIAGFAEGMVDAANRAANELAPGRTVDVAKLTTQIAMSVVGKALFDAETFDEADELGEALTTSLAWSDAQAGSPLMVAQLMAQLATIKLRDRLPASRKDVATRAIDALERPIAYRFPRARAARAAIGVIDRRIARMIEERRAVGYDREDLLTQLLRAQDEDSGSRMTDKQVRDEAVTLFVAGHETTATGLAWALYELARDPALCERVQREGDAIAGRPVRMEDLAKVTTSAKVFKEALRKYPPVYVIARETVEEVQIGEYTLPARTIVLVPPYAIHFNPKVYPDPDRFDPERFAPAAEASRHRSAWIPFSAGPRVCIGNHFALLEGQLVLATLAHRARFTLPPGRETVLPAPMLTLRPAGGMPMIVTPRASNGADAAHASAK